MAQKWRAVSLNNKLIVLFSGMTMIATVAYAFFAGWTLSEIHRGAADTRALAQAADTQAKQATEQVKALATLANETKRSADAATRGADAATSAARTASEALKASVSQFKRQVRPYIVVESARINKPPAENVIVGVESVLHNAGATPALRLRVVHTFHFEPTLPCHYAPGSLTHAEGTGEVGAGLKRAVRVFGERGLFKQEVAAIETKTLFLCYSGLFEYQDIFGDRHRTEACGYYQPPRPGTAVGEGDMFLYLCAEHSGPVE